MNCLSVLMILSYLRYGYSVIALILLVVSFILLCVTALSYKKHSEFSKLTKLSLGLFTIFFFLIIGLGHILRVGLCSTPYFTGSTYFLAKENYTGTPDLHSTHQLLIVRKPLEMSKVSSRLEQYGWHFEGMGNDGKDFFYYTKRFRVLPFRYAQPKLEIDVTSNNQLNPQIYLGNEVSNTSRNFYNLGTIDYAYYHELSRFEVWLIDKMIVKDISAALGINIRPQAYSKIRVDTNCFWKY